MYYILQDFEEVLDHDLSEEERKDILTHLDLVLKDTTHPDLANLAQSLKSFIQNKTWNWRRIRRLFGNAGIYAWKNLRRPG